MSSPHFPSSWFDILLTLLQQHDRITWCYSKSGHVVWLDTRIWNGLGDKIGSLSLYLIPCDHGLRTCMLMGLTTFKLCDGDRFASLDRPPGQDMWAMVCQVTWHPALKSWSSGAPTYCKCTQSYRDRLSSLSPRRARTDIPALVTESAQAGLSASKEQACAHLNSLQPNHLRSLHPGPTCPPAWPARRLSKSDNAHARLAPAQPSLEHSPALRQWLEWKTSQRAGHISHVIGKRSNVTNSYL